MPTANPAAVRKQIAQGKIDPIYLIVGDDEAEMSKLAADISGVVEDELRAFNLERLYANDKSVTPSAIVQAARTLPMLGDRRVVLVLRAERILKPKRRGKPRDAESAEEAEGAAGASATAAAKSGTRSRIVIVQNFCSRRPRAPGGSRRPSAGSRLEKDAGRRVTRRDGRGHPVMRRPRVCPRSGWRDPFPPCPGSSD